MKSTLRWKFIAAALGYALLCRLLPYALNLLNEAGVPLDPRNTWYPWNFSPVTAVCVFCGAVVPRRGWAIAAPLLMIIGSDILMNVLHNYQFANPRDIFVQLWVYTGFAMTAALGGIVRRHPSILTGVPTAMAGELLFFLLTNLMTWASGFVGTATPWYPMTAAGLWTCFVNALPFFGWSLASTAAYAGLFFSPWGLGLAGVAPSRTESSPQPVYETVRS
jgi:hypothetical protein